MKGEFSKIKYNNQFNKENYIRIDIAIKKDKGIKFKELCKKNGITQVSVLEPVIDQFINENDD